MSKDLGCKWNFIIRNEASLEQGREDSSFDYFKEKERCLVREYIQNSMDAYSERNEAPYVKVEFTFGKLLCADYPELLQSLPPRLKACSEYCQGNNAKDPYAEKYEYLTEHITGSIGYLKVSDYNTKGMPYDPDRFKKSKFKSCVRSANSSHKDSGYAGGSHGKGKSVGFVNSNINAVYYSTMTEAGDCYGEGVIKLCDHIYNDINGERQIYEDVAFYDSLSGKHPDTENIPEVFRRSVPGTDAFVLGIEQTDEYIINMKKEVLRSFFKAIKEKLLIVVVCGEEFTADNIADKLKEYYEKEGEFDSVRTRTPEIEFNPCPYYSEVLCKAGIDDDHRIFNSEVDFPGDFPTLGKTLVYFWKSDRIKQANSRDSVVYMRNNNMAIEVKRGRNNKGYYAIFVCEGVGSESLRHMENVTHDKWDTTDVTKENKVKANKILVEIKQLIIKCEKTMFPEDESEEKTIESLRNRRVSILGNNKNDDGEESFWPSTNITKSSKTSKSKSISSSILETLSGKRKKKKNKGKAVITDTNLAPSVTLAKKDDQETTPLNPNPEPPVPDPRPSEPPKPKYPLGIPEKPDVPSVDSDGNINGYINELEETGVRMREIKLDGKSKHLIPLYDGEFACKLVLSVPRDYTNCRMEIFVQGISMQIPLTLKRVSEGCTIGGVYSNEIIGFNLNAGNNFIKFTPIESVKNYTLIIKAYGY